VDAQSSASIFVLLYNPQRKGEKVKGCRKPFSRFYIVSLQTKDRPAVSCRRNLSA